MDTRAFDQRQEAPVVMPSPLREPMTPMTRFIDVRLKFSLSQNFWLGSLSAIIWGVFHFFFYLTCVNAHTGTLATAASPSDTFSTDTSFKPNSWEFSHAPSLCSTLPRCSFPCLLFCLFQPDFSKHASLCYPRKYWNRTTTPVSQVLCVACRWSEPFQWWILTIEFMFPPYFRVNQWNAFWKRLTGVQHCIAALL